MARRVKKEPSLALYDTIAQLKDADECRRFFEDLCAPTELRSMEQRYDVGVLLDSGMVYTDILERTGASSATISRVNRILTNGTGAFKELIDRSLEREKQA